MDAFKAYKVREDTMKVADELNKLSIAIGKDAALAETLSKEMGVFNVNARVEYAARLLGDYGHSLEAALRGTQVVDV